MKNLQAIATQHPQRDSRSSLLNNFNFRVFLFQDMDDGDSIVISARVIACVEAIDCSPVSDESVNILTTNPIKWSYFENADFMCGWPRTRIWKTKEKKQLDQWDWFCWWRWCLNRRFGKNSWNLDWTEDLSEWNCCSSISTSFEGMGKRFSFTRCHAWR